MENRKNKLIIACENTNFSNIVDVIDTLSPFFYVVVPLSSSSLRNATGVDSVDFTPYVGTDMLLDGGTWRSNVVGKMDTNIAFAGEDHLANNSRQIYQDEINWASHIALSAVVLPQPDWECVNYASCVSSMVNRKMKFWVEVKLEMPCEDRKMDAWECWNKFYGYCNRPSNVQVVLQFTAELPPDSVIDKWLSENIVAVILDTNLFISDERGRPVLSTRYQKVLRKFFIYNAQVILRGDVHDEYAIEFVNYLKWLYEQTGDDNPYEAIEKPWLDYLQSPLQPLKDNLGSDVYEVFEQDPVKYRLYEEAITACLSNEFLDEDEIILMVLGAGRGPLVRRAMAAAKTTGRNVVFYAIEKNPNAIVTLNYYCEHEPEWKKVTVIKSDIRKWNPDKKAHIIVSELLGSFGDNELSPECLYGAQHLLAENGISIPTSYTSYIAPMSSSVLYNKATQKDMGYVVKFHRVNVLCDPKPVFTFNHPSIIQDLNTTRTRTFEIPQNAEIHGIAGYFDSVLYGDVIMSICPINFSEGMFSWFPMYFPIQTPFYASAGSSIDITFLRFNDGVKVWYEWTIDSDRESTPLQNLGGSTYWIGL